MTNRIAVDVGGTFTDVIVLNEKTQELRLEKVETTPENPVTGVLNGFEKANTHLSEVEYFVHGTTLALNALLTRTTSRVAIITTKGFRDIYELGRTARDPMYDLTFRKPTPLVPRRYVFEVGERLNFEGDILKSFDENEALEVARKLRKEEIGSVAIIFLHSYANPSHELAMEAILKAEYPEICVSLSHQLSREYREYERTSTCVIDAAIKPLIQSYLNELDGRLSDTGFTGHFLLTRSGGGAMTVSAAKKQPAHLVLSGPAGGVIGASALSQLTNKSNLITLDMGGTSLDASTIINGQVTVNNEASFETFPINLPIIDINTIGAGGGSVGWIDDGGHLQVGPKSAGAAPGPACYGKGGNEPTFTDAALVAGYLDPLNFLGGTIPLNAELATLAIQTRLADELNLNIEEVAAGMLRISEAKITAAIREISIERGLHPADFSILAFGGGGGFVAAEVARELGIPEVIIPPGPSNFSALGMLMVDVVHDFAQTFVTGLEHVDPNMLVTAFGNLKNSASGALKEDGFSQDKQLFFQSAELRYEGQEHTVNVPINEEDITAQTIDHVAKTFNQEHETKYGHSMQDQVELVTLRVRAVGILSRPKLPNLPKGNATEETAKKNDREIFHRGNRISYSIFDRLLLGSQDKISGPAIIEEATSTTVIHQSDSLTVGDLGELVISVGTESLS